MATDDADLCGQCGTETSETCKECGNSFCEVCKTNDGYCPDCSDTLTADDENDTEEL